METSTSRVCATHMNRANRQCRHRPVMSGEGHPLYFLVYSHGNILYFLPSLFPCSRRLPAVRLHYMYKSRQSHLAMSWHHLFFIHAPGRSLFFLPNRLQPKHLRANTVICMGRTVYCTSPLNNKQTGHGRRAATEIRVFFGINIFIQHTKLGKSRVTNLTFPAYNPCINKDSIEISMIGSSPCLSI